MNDYKELIAALRCSASVSNGKCDENCPYRTLEEITLDFPLKADFTINGIGYWESCDCDRMILDAADAIEQLVNDRNASVDALKALVENIDAEPVRHGHWIELWFDEEDRLLGELPSDYKCSVCGGIVPRKTFQSGKYCPNCGAKMDEVSE